MVAVVGVTGARKREAKEYQASFPLSCEDMERFVSWFGCVCVLCVCCNLPKKGLGRSNGHLVSLEGDTSRIVGIASKKHGFKCILEGG